MQVAASHRDTDGSGTRISVDNLNTDVRGVLEAELRSALQEMFQYADDTLLALIERADTEQYREIYFDTLHKLHLHQDGLITAYVNRCLQSFDGCIKAPDSAVPYHLDTSLTMHDFSLTDARGAELNLAISNIKQRAYSDNWNLLDLLAKRFSRLLQRQFDVHTFPLAPDRLCAGLVDFVRHIHADSAVNLIALKLFDRFVTPCWSTLYRKIDRLIVDGDRLSRTDERSRTDVRSRTDERSRTNEGSKMEKQHNTSQVTPVVAKRVSLATGSIENSGNVGNDEKIPQFSRDTAVIQMLQELLHTPTQLSIPSTENSAPQTYSISELISVLSDFQAEAVLDPVGMDTLSSESIKARLQNRFADSQRQFQSKHENIIEIVSLLFQFIGGDRNLPAELTVLLAQLHVPFTKLALLDPAIFRQASHPARQLLNDLAFASVNLQWRDGKIKKDAPVLLAIEHAVTRVAMEYTDQAGVFPDIVAEFRNVISHVTSAQRETLQRLDGVNDKVISLIKRKLHAQPVPALIESFIRHAWYEVLVFIGRRDNCSGKNWDDCIHLLDDLIWSVQPKQLVQEREHLLKMIPALLNRLQEGLCFIDFSQTHLNQFFHHMQQIHIRCLNGISSQDDEHSVSNMAILDSPNSQDLYMMSDHLVDTVVSEVDTLASLESAELRNSTQHQTVEKLRPGTWVEFANGQSRQRGQLAWHDDYTGEFRFVDRAYNIVQELGIAQLVNKFERNEARIVADDALFDRAVNAVLTQTISSVD